MSGLPPEPSGSVLPIYLRRKWKAEKSSDDPSSGPLSQKSMMDDMYTHTTLAEKAQIVHRAFTSQEIEAWMEQISGDVLVGIQKQIHRGEESYFEETSAHGNLFRGWDSFVDAKDIGTANAATLPQGSRRIPADCRWFASSCNSRSRFSRPVLSLPKKASHSHPSSVLSSGPPRTQSAPSVSSSPTPQEAKPSMFEETSSKSENEPAPHILKEDDVNESVQESTKADDLKVDEMQAGAPRETNATVDPSTKTSGHKRKRQENKLDMDTNNELSPTKKKTNFFSNANEDTPIRKSKAEDASCSDQEKSDDNPNGSDTKDNEEDLTSIRKEDSKKPKGEGADDCPRVLETKSQQKEEKEEKEKPQKRRSSRNRKSTLQDKMPPLAG